MLCNETMSLHTIINALSSSDAEAALTRCCGSQRWVEAMLAQRPFASTDALFEAAHRIGTTLKPVDHLEAFGHHPKIGQDLASLREKFQTTKRWSTDEQSGVLSASEADLVALRDGNEAYERKFGFIFIICAQDMNAAQMLHALQNRLHNSTDQEITIAAAEQAKITKIRLNKIGEDECAAP